MFFDRSWYKRAVVEEGIRLFGYWFSIERREQESRPHPCETAPLKRGKLSTTDLEARRRREE